MQFLVILGSQWFKMKFVEDTCVWLGDMMIELINPYISHFTIGLTLRNVSCKLRPAHMRAM